MKNFSVNTADFDSLSISGESPIVQSDLGTAPNQIPLNKDLGSLAYMNAPQIEDLNVDTLELREIAAEISDTAVDVFVYDTRKDSDGGAWRHRTSHTSWYNEELNTATRGGRREFPAVAVIVAESDKVTIYDGDDPDLPMWYTFNNTSTNATFIVSWTNSSISMLNGVMYVGQNLAATWVNFITDTSGQDRETAGRRIYLGNIADLETTDYGFTAYDAAYAIVDATVNDVAMTVLPNAPIDSETGLPIPTIAVATNGGVSVIRDDGSVVDIGYGNSATAKTITYIEIDGDVIRFRNAGYQYNRFTIPDSDVSNYVNAPNFKQYSSYDVPSLIGESGDAATMSGAIGSDLGLSLLDENTNNFSSGMIAYTTSSYNTGWMPGDIKLATLSDTKNEKVGVDETTELVTNGGFDSNIDGWTAFEHAGITPTIEHDSTNGGRLKINTNGSYTGAVQTISNIKSGRYVVSANFAADTQDEFYVQVKVTGEETYLTHAVGLTNTNQQIEFDVPAGTTSIDVLVRGGVGIGIFYADNISVKQTGELITNGTFDDDSNWEKSSHWTISNGFASMPSTSDYKPLYQYNLGLIAGVKYVASVDVSALTGSIRFDTSRYDGNGITTSGGIQISTTGTHAFTFVADSSEDGIGLVRDGQPSSCTIDNISVRLAEDDRSVNNNGLQIFGEIDKTPVAPGADLVAYSGFSAENYLMQPYNSDLDFGTGDFCVSFWAYNNGLSDPVRIGKSTGGADGWVFTQGNTAEDFYIHNGDFSEWGVFADLSKIGVWEQFSVVRIYGDKWYVYKNGKLERTTDKLASNNFNDNGMLKLWATSATSNSVALLRISSTVPTPEQIAKIYRDEKVLFQDGAQATLYGTSDAVTALAYDDSDDLLHVGTASGRSVFNGLKRVDNTTTAVSTAISATEGLVIEQ